MSDPLRPRRVAASILGRVIREGAYSNVLLDAKTQELDPAEAARVKALVYGTLRVLPDLDRQIGAGSKRPLNTIENQLMDILRISSFEIRNSKVPDPVSVSVGVDLVREIRPNASGLANAILRRVAESTETAPTGLELPDWLRTRLEAVWNQEEIDAFAFASAEEPERVGRLRTGKPHDARPIATVAGAYVLPPGPVMGDFVIQDAASIAVGNAVRAEPGMRVLDVAAAPGGKTVHLLDQVAPDGIVVAADNQLRRARTGSKRVTDAYWVCADGRTPPYRPQVFDRILVDAPCSGLGTLRRRPEILYRAGSDDVARLSQIQRRLVESSLPLLKDGGELIYSVCTVTPDETVGVIAGLGFEVPDCPGDPVGDGRMMTPQATGTDGMFVARYRN